jgi:hypothetical protein
MTARQTLQRAEWLSLKAATRSRTLPPRKAMDAETEQLVMRRAQMMRGR